MSLTENLSRDRKPLCIQDHLDCGVRDLVVGTSTCKGGRVGVRGTREGVRSTVVEGSLVDVGSEFKTKVSLGFSVFHVYVSRPP